MRSELEDDDEDEGIPFTSFIIALFSEEGVLLLELVVPSVEIVIDDVDKISGSGGDGDVDEVVVNEEDEPELPVEFRWIF